ncbi:hypothetical protein PILCRDRAFT_14627 [Piloderma croceum F 1598]|uniref:Uncharacterized protein n=1 Tax=Piloderma croceum (strain F 1598) TaxID=765440 RepID=A0A0C3BA25_PILCF|nr:hypothetical protein PILCRDRAFT_14627 [Piloderma croceum F 1598]
MSSDNPASQVYAKRLLEEVGYLLWYPDLPPDQNVVQAYRDRGAGIDHVDNITGDGEFESLGFEFTPFSPKDAIFIIPDRAAREDHYEYIKEDFYNRLIDGVLYSKRIE